MNTYEKNAAFFLIDDENNRSFPCPFTNWDTDFRGAGRALTRENGDFRPFRRALSTIKGAPTTIKRDVNEQFSGTLTFECCYIIKSGDGLHFSFYGDKGKNEAVKIKQKGDFFYCENVKLFKADNNKHYIKFILDIDAGVFSLYHDGKYIASCHFTGTAKSINSFRFGYGEEDLGEAGVYTFVKMYKNYLVNDKIIWDVPGVLPDDYIIEKTGKSVVARVKYSAISDECVYSIKAMKGSDTSIIKNFARADGVVCLDIKYYLPKAGGKASFSLMQTGKEVVTISDCLDEISAREGALRKHSKNVWQDLRIEADLDAKNALIRLNGKKVTVISLDSDADFIDAIKINFSADSASELQLCDIFAFVIPPFPADYVPEPVIPEKKGDYVVGMNICSLWRTGDHYGWDWITPFKDTEPVIGFYDEGLPETADWELKFMAEHGVDFQLYCWYSAEGSAPIRRTQLASAIHGGHMLAKYSDKVKLALLWEARAGAKPNGFEGFKKYFVPYWIDHFFSDPRYMTIDGYAIMSIYGPQQLVKDFGDEAGVKKALDYLRSEVKKLGYKGLIIMGCADNLPIYKACGFDAVHAYNWGSEGYDVEYTKSRINANLERGNVHTVPTVSTGYNIVGWTGFRFPTMKPDDMVTALTWCRDEVLPTFEKGWKQKLVMLSTWNEYGEGTYIMPDHLNGFGYLDAVRKVFMQDITHTDAVPNEEQKSRICHLHPVDRRNLAPLDYIQDDKNDHGVYKRYEFKTQEDLDKWEFHGFSSLEIKNGILFGHSDVDDPYMVCKDEELFPLPAHKIVAIRANIRGYKPVNQMCCIEAKFAFGEDKQYNPRGMYCLTDPDKIVPLEIRVNRTRGYPWKGLIHSFRFDPIYAVGDFELESIELLAAPPHYTLNIDGLDITAKHYPMDIDGEIFVPFDTKSDIVNTPNMYYEWNAPLNQLVIMTDKEYIFTLGNDEVICENETITMSKPLEMYDGIPLIPLKLFAKIICRKLDMSDETINLHY